MLFFSQGTVGCWPNRAKNERNHASKSFRTKEAFRCVASIRIPIFRTVLFHRFSFAKHSLTHSSIRCSELPGLAVFFALLSRYYLHSKMLFRPRPVHVSSIKVVVTFTKLET